MKGKFLVAATAAMALAACTAEDNVVSQGQTAKTSPITFTVVQDGVDTKAAWGGANGHTLTFKEGDLMSLFHGGELAPDGNSTFYRTDMRDAIYKAAKSENGTDLTFTTQSMVEDGQAIMVYPADLSFEFEENTEALSVKIPTEQTAENVLKNIPFVSEGIKIEAYNESNEVGTAGYGKNYFIKMKQIGTLVTMKPQYENKNVIDGLVTSDEIDPISITKVTLKRPTNKFNTKMNIALDAATSVDVYPYNSPKEEQYKETVQQSANWPADVREISEEHYGEWNKVSSLNLASAEQNETLTFSGDAAETAQFLLLPQDSVQTSETALAKDEAIKVETNYGFVTLEGDATVMYRKIGEEFAYGKKLTVAEGLNDIIAKTNLNSTSNTFYGEQVGVSVTSYVDVDLATLDMSDLHIKSDKQLHDVLLVWNALQPTKNVVLTIDGDANKRFELSMDNVKRLQSAPYNTYVTLNACQVSGEECSTIVINGNETNEVPAIDFLDVDCAAVTIELAEGSDWTWTGGAKTFDDNATKLVNKGTITIAQNATVADAMATLISVKNEECGTININGGVTKWQLNLNNYGVVNIAKGAELRADQESTVIKNDASSLSKFGTVNNSGVFATSNNGVIRNFGIIYHKVGGNANMTYITANETAGSDVAKAWANDNKLGTIVIQNPDDNISVSNVTSMGLIKYVYGEETYTTPEVCRYNYIIVRDHDITFPATEAGYAEVKFLEINGNAVTPVVYQSENTLTALRGFIVNGKANLKENNVLYTPAANINGTFYYGGDFAASMGGALPNLNANYFGNSSNDCIVKY